MEVMQKAFYNFNYKIPEHEFDGIANKALFVTQKNFDETRGARFSTLLWRNMENACKDYLISTKNYVRMSESKDSACEVQSRAELTMKDCVESLPVHFRTVINQKYYQNMTLEEIGEANAYSRMTALRILRSAETQLKALYLDGES